MSYDVVALGELLIDFTQNGVTAQGNPAFGANPGGAPANVLSMLQKLGKRTAFIGKVGDDMFGRLLIDTLNSCGIGTEGVSVSGKANTTLAFVQNKQDGEREFSFYRKPGADTMLDKADIKADLIASARIFHFGSLSLTDEPARSATRYAVQIARDRGILISFDPNLRPALWRDNGAAAREITWGMGNCDIVKLSEEEALFLSGLKAVGDSVSWLKTRYPDIKLFLVSLGVKGSMAYADSCLAESPAFLLKETIDTTGAGDTFFGCCLSYILDNGMGNLSTDRLAEMLRYANAAAALVTTRKGALCSMPSMEEIDNLLRMGQSNDV
jgi:fructokinase